MTSENASKTRLARVPNWQGKLAACVDEALRTPFEWGRHDCMLFAADCVHAITGVDFGAPYRGTYSDEAGAMKIIARFGRTIPDMVRGILEADPIPVAYARRGDVVVGQVPHLTVGICLGAHCAYPTGDTLAMFGREKVVLAWSIG